MTSFRTLVSVVLCAVPLVMSVPRNAHAQAGPAEEVAAQLEAADHGDVDAQLRLGTRYLLGDGVKRDDAQAAAWWRKAADLGQASAQYNLGYLYLIGRGVQTDAVQAMEWYHKAADQGHAQAEKDLGVLYFKGQGVARDYVEAHKWYSIAASRVSASLQQIFAAGRDEIAALMTPQQIAEAQKLAGEWQAAFEQHQR